MFGERLPWSLFPERHRSPDRNGEGPREAPRLPTEFKISEEPLAERVLRQVRSGKLDESRLLASTEKRARDVGTWAGQAYAVVTGRRCRGSRLTG